jgi:hypothetical protein
MPFPRSLPLGLVAWLLVLPSCGDFFEKLGNSDQGYFDISPRTSLARGGWLTFTVRDYEPADDGPSNIDFQLVKVSDDSTAHIQSVGKTEATLVVQGLAAGNSHVDFRAVADGETKDDGFTVTVAEVTRLGFDPCHANGRYVRGTDGPVKYAFNPSSYPTVKGLGLYPFTMAPADAVTLRTDTSTDAQWIFSIPATAPAQVVLASSLPDDQAHFTMNIVDRSAIDGVFSTASSASAGTYTRLTLVPSAAGVPVCVYAKRKITSATPMVCSLVADVAHEVASLTTYDDAVSVHMIAAGACKLVLEIGELAFTGAMPELTVAPHTSSGGGGGDWD